MKTGNHPPPVLFCIGPEKWLREQAIQRLKKEWVSPGFEEMDVTLFLDPPTDPRMILEAVRTLPFGSPARLVVVQGFTQLEEKSIPWLSDLLVHPPGRSCLLLCGERAGEGVLGRAEILWCQPLKGRELENWVAAQAVAAGAGIEPEAAALLIRRLGNGLQSLAQAVEGLTLFAGLPEKITKAHVEGLIVPSIRETVFELLDTAAAGQPGPAMMKLKQAIAQGHLTIEQFMGALGWYYRTAWKRKPTLRIQEAMEQLLQAEVDLKLGHPAPEFLADQLLLRLGS
ncbi:MAG: DNA polymerase III subunit delta [Candidatus Omnitrophica bacterium]|nr:DNA polymerase III subunit delta [Candidatus Omnitrophota bacterium]